MNRRESGRAEVRMGERRREGATGIQVSGSIEITVVGAVLLFVARHTFSAAYFLSLGLSPDYRLQPPDSAVWPVALLAVTAIIVVVTSRVVERWSESTFGGLGLAVMCSLGGVGAAVGAWQAMRDAFQAPAWARTTISVLLASSVLIVFWVRPVYGQRGPKSYWRKVAEAFQSRATLPGPSMPVPRSALRRAFSLGGAGAWIPVSAVLTIVSSAALGSAVAANQYDWIEVDTGDPHPSIHRVVFTRSDETLWAVELAEDGTLSSAIHRVDPGDRQGCTLRSFTMRVPAHARRRGTPTALPTQASP